MGVAGDSVGLIGALSRGNTILVLLGVELFTQSAVLGNGSLADNTTSNGIKGTIGNL
mgnify:CR=1 FL=1